MEEKQKEELTGALKPQDSPRRFSTINPLHNYKPTSPRTQEAMASPKEDRKGAARQKSECCSCNEKWNALLYGFFCLSCWHHCCFCKDNYENL